MMATYNILRYLARRNHHVTVYTTQLIGRAHRVPHSSLVNTNLTTRVHWSWIEGAFLSPTLTWELARLRVSQFDVVYVANCRNFPSTIGLLIGRKLSDHVVFAANGTLLAYPNVPGLSAMKTIAHRVQDIFLPGLLRHVSLALAVSREEVRHYLSFGIDPSRIELVGNGVDLEIFKPGYTNFRQKLGLLDDFIICYVGRLDPIKGLTVLLEAFQLLKRVHGSSKLLFLGPDFGMKQILIRRASEMKLQSHVLFVDPMPQEELVSAYRAADVVVIPSYFEIFGLSALEAVACGIPVIASDVGGLREIIQDGVNGYLVAPGNPSAIASKLLLLAENSKRATLSHNSAEGARRFDMDRVASKVEDALRRTAGC